MFDIRKSRFSSQKMRDARAALDQVRRADPTRHRIEIDENSHGDDVAYQAYCVADDGSCGWCGVWYHSEDYDGSLSRPLLEAQTDGAVHLASVSIAEMKQ